ncbi:MAG TPA: ferredoxin [Caulobacteraceae bacterium]|jgi:ferredoxin|nr:ferredoxin [Caulobacteraceae bacterium]
MKVVVNTSTCVGGGQCAASAETVFTQDDKGLVVLLKADVHGEEAEAARMAAFLCPSRSIAVEE